ncbi:hypothetical protein AK812_SmicGene22813 [Symbiodinium microadriaticum]|uniref:CCHC-type domain-containing protein n=1 Tax=Symbiodinium microadriaticum TaxID=2951 RepID=A0A1Q9DIW0_SYMMI|nr:hypothetical protein AK812_SmicGene22813 [Symbiodinium microadriaticum]
MSTSTSAPAATPETPAGAGDDRTSLPWAAIPRYVPGVTDTAEYGKKLKFLAEVWPKEHLSSLAPRVALLCEGSAFKKIARLDAAKLKVADTTGVELIVKTLGGAWGQTILEEKYEQFEKAIFGTVQRSDETHDSYLARHDIHFEELLAQNITFEELRSYVLLRQSQLSSDDKKRIVVEHGGKLTYEKVKSSIRLLGSRFFGEFQGQRANPRTKVYDANTLEEFYAEEPEKAFQATATSSNPSLDENEGELEPEFLEAMAAQEDSDALQVQSFEEELEGYFQETPDLQEALVSYLEARSRLLAKKKSRGFWPVGGSGKGGGKGGRGFKGGKGRGKSGREQLLARISRSVCRACGEKGHWKAECPKFGRPGSMSGKGEATTTVAEVLQETYDASATSTSGDNAVLTTVPEEAFSLEEAFIATCTVDRDVALRLPSAGKASLTDPESHAIMLAMALVASETVKAILDTGASCCVMGKQLLPAFLRQLSDATRQQDFAPETVDSLSGKVGAGDDRTSLPWAAIPRYVPGVTDTTEYGKKLKFLAEVWPKEHLSSLAPRVALLCEGSAFKKIARLDAAKLKVADTTGVELIVKTLGGAWGQTILEEKYEQFEKAIFGTVQRSDETHDSYLARHDIHFEELLAQNITFEELRSYVLLRQSQLSSDDKKRIVVEHGGKLTYEKVKSSIRLLGSRFFGEFQGQRANPRTKVYDANTLEEFYAEEPEKAFQATATSSNPSLDENEGELEPEFLEAMAAQEDSDALQVQSFEEELEGYFQETPDLQEALVSYLEARSRLLAKKKSRGFWPVGGSGKGGGKGGRGFKGGKGRGKSGREQLLARISRSVCRACGEKGHWKAECPKFGRPGSMSGKGEATTTVAEVLQETYDASATSTSGDNAVLTTVPEEAFSLEEAFIATCTVDRDAAERWEGLLD